jgi:hypothetical protein
MGKYYVQTQTLRLVLDAPTARGAAVRAIQWCHDRQAEIFREPAGDRIRDAEVLHWQVGRRITVSEVGFDGGDGGVKIFKNPRLRDLTCQTAGE